MRKKGNLILILRSVLIYISCFSFFTLFCILILSLPENKNWLARHIDLEGHVIPVLALILMVGIPGAIIFNMLGRKYLELRANEEFSTWIDQQAKLTLHNRGFLRLPHAVRRVKIFCIIIGIIFTITGICGLTGLFVGIVTAVVMTVFGSVLVVLGSQGFSKTLKRGQRIHRCPGCGSGSQYIANTPVKVSGGPVILCKTCGAMWLKGQKSDVQLNTWWPLNVGLFGAAGGLVSLATGPVLQNINSKRAVILVRGSEVTTKDETGWTPLHAAAFNGRKNDAASLIVNNAEVNAKDYEGKTPLHAAAEHGKKDVVELLLANNASVNAETKDGRRPILFAIENGYNDIEKLLRQNGGLD